MRLKVKISLIIVFGLFMLKTNTCAAQKFTKHELKSAYVYNFIRFVDWLPEKETISIGIIGNNQFTEVLKYKLTNQKIENIQLKVNQFFELQDYTSCDVIYIANDDNIDDEIILEKIKGKSILTIGEKDGFCLKGGIINFIEGDNGNYFFEINQKIALQEKIKISSKLLKLAIDIK
tara:strand:+ start:13642 stop:14169 length:528 start_codon:yes stop_codon:yes gene_type:complete